MTTNDRSSRRPLRRLRRRAGAAAFAFALLSALVPAVLHAATTGGIGGTVRDQTSGDPLVGAVVILNGTTLSTEIRDYTNTSGRFLFTALVPGEYRMRIEFAKVRAERGSIVVHADRVVRVEARLPADATDDHFQVPAKGGRIDVASAQVATTVAPDLAERIPLGATGFRTLDDVLTLAPGVVRDGAGVLFHGATGLENRYLIDGLDTTDPVLGRLSARPSLAFLAETTVIGGGYQIDYGHASGGIVNAITRSGSDALHGRAWFSVQPFQLAAPSVAALGDVFARSDRLGRAFDFGFDLGGPIIKRSIYFYVGFNPQLRTLDTARLVRRRLDANLPPTLPPGAVYPGDLEADPLLRCPSYLSTRQLCPGAAYLTATIDEATQRAGSASRLYSWIAKLSFRSDRHLFELEYLGNPETYSGVVGTLGGGRGSYLGSRTLQNHDVLGHLTSQLAGGNLELKLFAGYHASSLRTRPDTSAGGDGPANLDLRSADLSRFEAIAPCLPSAPPRAFSPCPIDRYQDGGLGRLDDANAGRFHAALGLRGFFRFLGSHQLRFGADLLDERYRRRRAYTGDALYTTFSDGTVERRQYAQVGDNNAVELLDSGFEARTAALRGSLYAHDAWSISFAPGLTILAGVRWEPQELRDRQSQQRVRLLNNVAPRLGLTYDITRRGLLRIYLHYNTLYQALPLDIADRRFTREAEVVQRSNNCPSDGAGRIDVARCTFTQPTISDLIGGTPGRIAPSVRSPSVGETTAGLQYDVGWGMVVGAGWVRRDLGRTVEDVAPDGQRFILGNPGEAPSQRAINRLNQEIADLQVAIASTNDPAQRRTLQAMRRDRIDTLALYNRLESVAKPQRIYDALVLTIEKQFANRVALLLHYVYSRTIGNYTGAYDPNSAGLVPNLTAQYNTADSLVNRSGRLPSDRPHNLRLTGTYALPLRSAELNFGATFSLLSGIPIDVLGGHPLLGSGQTFILPRAAGGRTPLLTTLDLHIGYRRPLHRGLWLEASWDIFNLANQRQATSVDANYTFDDVAPISNGRVSDLARLRNTSGAPVRVNPNFGQPTSYQPPLTMRFGVRIGF